MSRPVHCPPSSDYLEGELTDDVCNNMEIVYANETNKYEEIVAKTEMLINELKKNQKIIIICEVIIFSILMYATIVCFNKESYSLLTGLYMFLALASIVFADYVYTRTGNEIKEAQVPYDIEDSYMLRNMNRILKVNIVNYTIEFTFENTDHEVCQYTLQSCLKKIERTDLKDHCILDLNKSVLYVPYR